MGSAGDFAADYKPSAGGLSRRHMTRSMKRQLFGIDREVPGLQKRASVDGIASCKIRSIILPLLADHVFREANHYLRLLES